MPTARGWLVAATGIGLWIAGRGFGAGALEQLGFALLLLVILAVGVVRLGRHDLRVERSVSPGRVQVGREVSVTLRLHNQGRGAAPLMLLEDRIPAELAGRARFAVNGIESTGHRDTAYALRPNHRGRFGVGPLDIAFTDPFGVAKMTSRATGVAEFLAYPRTEQLTLPKDTGQKRTMVVSARRQPTGSQGDDFYTLREYVEGDDLRKIHWPATAKRNRYMVRQEETPWHARATILLDDRRGGLKGPAWERGVEAAASFADLYHRSSYSFRLLGAHETGIPSSRGPHHFHRCLDLLATIDQSSREGALDPLLLRLVELEAQDNVEGVLILVTGNPTREIAHALTRCAARYKMVAVVTLPDHRFAAGARPGAEEEMLGSVRLLDRAGIRTLVMGPGDRLAHAWSTLWSTTGPAGVVAMAEGGGEAWDRKPEHA